MKWPNSSHKFRTDTEKAVCRTNWLTHRLVCQTRCLSISDTSLYLILFQIHWPTERVIDWFFKLLDHDYPYLLSEKLIYFYYWKPLSISVVWNDSNYINCRILFCTSVADFKSFEPYNLLVAAQFVAISDNFFLSVAVCSMQTLSSYASVFSKSRRDRIKGTPESEL
jgi:hypothetical protein